MTSEKARIAVIGTGWWSNHAHIPALKENPNAELVALCDRQEDRLRRSAEAYGPVKTYTDLDEMLATEKLDGAIVCVNHAAHYECAKACLDAGLHIIVDKPLVLTARDAYDLEKRAHERGLELIVGYPWHYTDVTKRARDIVQSGQLGPVQYVSCLFTSMVIEFLRGNDQAYQPAFGFTVTGPGQVYSDPRLSGGGQGHLQVTHSAGTLFFVTGLQADKVTCFMENLDLRVDVADAIAVRFKPVDRHAAVGVLGSTANVAHGDSGHLELQVYCEYGRLTLNQSHGTLVAYRHDGTEMHLGPLAPQDRYPAHAPSANLVDVILGRARNGSPVEVGVRVVELLDAAYRSSAAGGQPISISEL